MVLFIAQLFRSYLRPVLQGKAKEIMTWLLLQGEIRIGQVRMLKNIEGLRWDMCRILWCMMMPCGWTG